MQKFKTRDDRCPFRVHLLGNFHSDVAKSSSFSMVAAFKLFPSESGLLARMLPKDFRVISLNDTHLANLWTSSLSVDDYKTVAKSLRISLQSLLSVRRD